MRCVHFKTLPHRRVGSIMSPHLGALFLNGYTGSRLNEGSRNRSVASFCPLEIREPKSLKSRII
jgi:hypothetical protein